MSLYLLLVGGAAVVAAVGMEGWAALLHRRLWHGPWWNLHRSHHRGRGDTAAGPDAASRPPGWQLNDALSLMHAPLAACLIAGGLHYRPSPGAGLALGVGAGMSFFGAAYVLVHDGFVHRRLPLRAWGRWRYLRRVQAAHALHHRTGGAPFGLFASPWLLAGAVAEARAQGTMPRARAPAQAAAKRRTSAPARAAPGCSADKRLTALRATAPGDCRNGPNCWPRPDGPAESIQPWPASTRGSTREVAGESKEDASPESAEKK